MNVLILGGTGSVGSEVSRALVARGANVQVLCRSDSSVARTEELGGAPVRGNISRPEEWLTALGNCDAVVQAAASFGDEMGDIDAGVVTALIRGLSGNGAGKCVIYTGGVWVFGDNTDPADETSAYAPPREWMWMAENAERVLHADGIDGRVVHPAIVVEDSVGVPALMLSEARATGEVRLPVALSATWPLVSQLDLGELYASVLDKGVRGDAYIGVSEPAVPLSRIAGIVGELAGLASPPVHWPLSYWMDKYGNWASGYGLSQHLVSDKARRDLGWQPKFRIEG